MKLTETQKALQHTQCTVCNENELSEMDSVGDDLPFLWCPNCESTVDGNGVVERGHSTDYIYDVNVCPSSLNEWGKPMTEGETAHKWDEDTKTCNECGATQESTGV